jgi:hypothetical protein
MQVTFADFDRLQNNLRQATDDILRLQARVTALEGGAPLPAEQPVIHKVSCEQVVMATAPAPQQPKPEPTALPDIASGWVGGRRN